MWGCEICIHCKKLQHTLQSWRRRHAANKIIIILLSFLMVMYRMRLQERYLIQWYVQNNLVPFYLTGSVWSNWSVWFENVITVQSIMLLDMNQAVQLLIRKLNFIFMLYSKLVLFVEYYEKEVWYVIFVKIKN